MNYELKKEASLKRTLGLFTSTLLVVGLVIGSGVFKKVVPMAQTGLGETAILMAWIAAGIITLFAAFILSGLASLTEESGGIYEYFRISFGNFPAFLSGWASFTIVDSGACAALGFLFGQTLNTIVPLPNPLQSWEHISIANSIFPFSDFGVKLVGIAAIVFVTGVNFLGVREGGTFNNIITIAKIGGILLLIFFGLAYKSPDFSSVAQVVAAPSAPEGMLFYSAFLTAMLAAFWAYNGLDVVTNISGEMINPKRDLPLAMTFGTLLLITIYVLTNYSYMQVLSLGKLSAIQENEIGAFVVAETLLGSTGRLMLLILFLISVFGALNSNMVTVPRKYFRMAQEGYFFQSVKKVHPRFKTPHLSLLYTMIMSCLLLLSGTFETLTDMVIFTSFLFFGLLSIAVIKMKRNGTIKVKIVGYPVIPIAFLVFCLALSINTIWVHPKQSLIGLLLILIGLPFYYYFKKENARQDRS